MAIDWFKGRTKEELEAALRDAQDDLLAGKSVMSSGAGDVNKSERIEESIRQRIKNILKALSVLDPATYPPSSCNAITTTRAAFSSTPDATSL